MPTVNRIVYVTNQTRKQNERLLKPYLQRWYDTTETCTTNPKLGNIEQDHRALSLNAQCGKRMLRCFLG